MREVETWARHNLVHPCMPMDLAEPCVKRPMQPLVQQRLPGLNDEVRAQRRVQMLQRR
jgi:hypothetical protein